jgi:hypothetical protein
MQTDFESLLPFLAALKRQTGTPEDDDDGDAQSGALVENQAETQTGAPAGGTKGSALLRLLQSGLNSSAQTGGGTESGDPNQTQAASGGQNGGVGGQDTVSPAGSQVVTVNGGPSRIPRLAAMPDVPPPNLRFNDPIQKRETLNQLAEVPVTPPPLGVLPDGSLVQDMGYLQNVPSRIPSGGWVASGDPRDPYSWVDHCQGQGCMKSVAAVVGKDVVVYGSGNAQDKTTYRANKSGMVGVRDLSNHADSNFDVADGQAHPEEYLDAPRAAALFNVATQYGKLYANDDPLVFTAGSTANGAPAIGDDGLPVHQSHHNGANIDLRYMGSAGASLRGATAYSDADLDRNQVIMELFRRQNANLGATLTGDPSKFGFDPINETLRRIHQTHMHFQNSYPAVKGRQ